MNQTPAQSLTHARFDSLTLGDIKAGVERLERQGVSGETGLALAWLASLAESTRGRGFSVHIEGVELDGKPNGDWAMEVHVEGYVRGADPAAARVLRQDGDEMKAFADALPDDEGMPTEDKARRVAFALLMRQIGTKDGGRWTWSTPLGRTAHVVVCRMRTTEQVA